MRTLDKNKTRLYYALYSGQTPITETYVDAQENETLIETGETRTTYDNPVEFRGNISLSGGESSVMEYGVSVADYEAILVVDKESLPIDETSRIWHETVPVYNEDGTVDETSADYTVAKVSRSINFDKYVLRKVVK